MPETTRLTNIDALRGLASLSVCWFHMTNTYTSTSNVRASGNNGWLGVEVFFVISGFIVPYALSRGGYQFGRDWKTFMWKRVLRIEPPYLLAMLLALALWFASSLAPGFQGQKPNVSATQVLLHVGYLNGIFGFQWLNPVFWTLAIEFQFYLLVSLIFSLLSNSNRGVLFATNGMLLVAALTFSSKIYVFHFLGLFLLGITAYQYRDGRIDIKVLTVMLLLATATIWLTHNMLVALICLSACIVLLGAVSLAWGPILFLGTISYSLYLVHVPIGGRVVNLGRRYIDTQLGEAVVSITGVLVSIAVAYAFYRLIEKPSQALASKIKYGR